MAKRVRGVGAGHRPGGLGPSRARRAPGDPASADATHGGSTDIDAAIGLVESDYVAMALQEDAPVARKSPRVRRSARSDELASRVAAESVYVREDLRRIGVVSVILLVSLAGAWIVFVMLDVLGLY